MIKKIILAILICSIAAGIFAYGQETSHVGTSMANFLKIGAGSRSAALGDAYVALANDVSALYWNPAGLALLNKAEVLFQSTAWIAGTNLYFSGLAFPLGNMGTIGASIYGFSSGDIQETTLAQPEGTGRNVSANDMAIGVSYGYRFTDRFSAGTTIKYISERLSREKASTFAFDVGSIFITNFLHEMRIGISLSNLGGRMLLEGPDLIVSHDLAPDLPTNKYADASLSTQDWDIPLVFRFGLATDVFKTENSNLLVAASLNDSRDYDLRFNFGTEFSMNILKDQSIFLRGGYKGNYDEEGLCAGGGLILKLVGYNLKIDYAYSDTGRLGNAQRYSLGIEF